MTTPMNDQTSLAMIPPGEIALKAQPLPAVQDAPDSLLNAIVAMAKDPAVDVAKLSAILEMQERLERRQAEVEFARALARIPPIRVKKDGTIDLTRKDGSSGGTMAFAKWETMASVIDPLLQAEGFRLMFDSTQRAGEGGGIVVTGTLLHRDGHSKAASMSLALDTGPGRNNLQAMGSSLSYGKRYCAEMLLNIVREGVDDDGKRGGTKYITAEQVAELIEMAKAAKREEGPFLDRIFGGTVRSFDEIEVGSAFLAVKNTLAGLVKQQKEKAP